MAPCSPLVKRQCLCLFVSPILSHLCIRPSPLPSIVATRVAKVRFRCRRCRCCRCRRRCCRCFAEGSAPGIGILDCLGPTRRGSGRRVRTHAPSICGEDAAMRFILVMLNEEMRQPLRRRPGPVSVRQSLMVIWGLLETVSFIPPFSCLCVAVLCGMLQLIQLLSLTRSFAVRKH